MQLKDIFKFYNPCAVALQKPYIIAEAGVNHEGDMNIARRLIDEAKEGMTVVIRTHGISPQEEEKLKSKGVRTVDTTCPLVKKAQLLVKKIETPSFFSEIPNNLYQTSSRFFGDS